MRSFSMPRKSKKLNSDEIRIKHMIDAANEALSFVKGKKRSDLDCNRQLTLSLIKEIEMIGEAASTISDSFKKNHSEGVWDLIIGARNRLIHGYFDVDLDIIWKTVTENLPELVKQLKEIS